MSDTNASSPPVHAALEHAMGSTLPVRRRPTKLQLEPERPSHRQHPAEDRALLSGELRVVNEDRERLGSDTSGVMDLQSSSSMPYAWSAGGFTEHQDRKARWKDSPSDSNGKTSPIPLSFHGQTVALVIKLRLLPVMKTLIKSTEKNDLMEALKHAEAVLDYAVQEDATPALQGRCCYYIGVALHLLDEKNAFKFFVGALDAKGVYEEGRWAQQWINHYESMAELSPKRLAHSDRPISWSGDIGDYLRNDRHENEATGGIKAVPKGTRQRSEVQREPLDEGVQITTPVRQRFSLDIIDDLDENYSFDSDSINRRPGTSLAGREWLPSISSWGSPTSSSKTIEPARRATDGSRSPSSTPTSATHRSDGYDGIDKFTSSDLVSPASSTHHTRSESVTFNSTVREPEVEG